MTSASRARAEGPALRDCSKAYILYATRMSRELPIPENAATTDDAVELVRVWAAKGGQHVSLATGVWDDPAAWGLMLVDLAQHVASAYAETTGMERDAVLARIKSGFDAEWPCLTDAQRTRS